MDRLRRINYKNLDHEIETILGQLHPIHNVVRINYKNLDREIETPSWSVAWFPIA